MAFESKSFLNRHHKLALIVFEFFRITVFLSGSLATDTATEMPQFLYVNL
jgi:hypothetical protein